ncbi:FtsH protease activity modulator HflK [candidate division KSB1 bacterium]|nr:FtsH protease activity modulator HflK [candidate division KSB1 bacterium]RQW04141.1 MAG: FtsH protease activity modulator HflK [candidate division KSB1 bacterium]
MKKRVINIGGEQIEMMVPDKRIIMFIILGIIGLWIVLSSVYTVDADEVGVIRRFGKHTRTTDPGLNFKLPWGIEKVTKVKVERVYKEEFGFRTVSAGVRTEYSSADYSSESLMLTGDLNSALVEWIVQYRIKDPVAYLFRVKNVERTIRYVSESILRQVVGDNSVDEVITVRRQDIAPEVKQLMQELLDEYETGIDIVTVNLQDVNPPQKVQPAFNEVNEAEQDKERIINEALQVYNSAIPKAKGEAEQQILEAEGYATNRINRAKGDAEKFIAVWREYNKAKDVTQRRLYLEMMQDVLPKLDKKIIVDEDLKSFLPLLQLDTKGGAR